MSTFLSFQKMKKANKSFDDIQHSKEKKLGVQKTKILIMNLFKTLLFSPQRPHLKKDENHSGIRNFITLP